MPRRLFVLGTDTHAGKTFVSCALLRAFAHRGVPAVPFKPTMSGGDPDGGDAGALARAAELDPKLHDLVAPLRYGPPLAPGIADDPAPFIGTGPSATDPQSVMAQVQWNLARLEQATEPRVTLVEGAGGLLVPMPGGTWLEDWIETFDATPVVVGRLGLGTINHTLLTLEALAHRGHTVPGFILTQLRDFPDRSRRHNARIIEHRSGVPCLGILPHQGRPGTPPETDDWLEDGWLERLGI